jgi:hypothetical protein
MLEPLNNISETIPKISQMRWINLLDNLKRKVDIFNSDGPSYFMRVIIYYEHKYFHITAKRAHCEFHYNGVNLIVGKKTFNGHAMMMVIGNEMHKIGILHNDHFPISLMDACPPPEETAYSCFLKYPGFANTCLNKKDWDYQILESYLFIKLETSKSFSQFHQRFCPILET